MDSSLVGTAGPRGGVLAVGQVMMDGGNPVRQIVAVVPPCCGWHGVRRRGASVK